MWIARTKRRSEKSGTFLGLYENEPIYSERFNLWLSPIGLPLYIDDREFPSVTFETSPQQVEIKLI
jgi:hypothetical protein